MPRTRAFEEEVVVDKAMRLFWRRGYRATPLPHLLKAMGLSRSSFYHAFGSKRRVLEASIRRYMARGMDGVLSPILAPDAGRREIEETFARMVAHCAGPRGPHGCLVNNCMTETALHDATVLDALKEARAGVAEGFARAVARGQADGTIATREDARAMGRFLLNTFAGMNVAAKGKPGRDVLTDIARVALRALD